MLPRKIKQRVGTILLGLGLVLGSIVTLASPASAAGYRFLI